MRFGSGSRGKVRETTLLSPFSVNAGTIGMLPGDLFTLFCTDLVRAEASRVRLPQRLIDDTVRETAPDGGMDLLIGESDAVDKPASWGEWAPEGVSVWQYKSGKCPSANTLAKDDLLTPDSTSASGPQPKTQNEP